MHVAPSLPMACIIHSLRELAEATCMCSKTDQLTVNDNCSYSVTGFEVVAFVYNSSIVGSKLHYFFMEANCGFRPVNK